MPLNHLNLTVTNAGETAAFLSKYFDLKPFEGAPEPSASMAFLTDSKGMVLTMIRGKRDVPVVYPANFHIGFIQASEAKVDEINARLKADGYEVPEPARLHGSWTFYFTAPGGFTVEVLA